MSEDDEIDLAIAGVKMIEDVEEFHKKFRLEYDGKPRHLPADLRRFRLRFLNEELHEYIEAGLNLDSAIKAGDDAEITHWLEQQLDALMDLCYVAIGTGYLQGFDMSTAWIRIQRANMAKVRAEHASQSKRGSHYDVIKPDGWTPPDHKDLVEDHEHRQGVLPL